MAFVGSCQDMCPPAERQKRYGLYMSLFEKDNNNQPNENAMVKEYRRSGADQEEPLPSDLRTIEALELTMNYLVRNIMDDPRSRQHDIALEWYDFLWDRLRAIRKDITQQNICDHRTALLVERCARFHVHACYALNRIKDFDVELNKRNLNDCLQMLRQMYSDLRTSTGTACQSEIEFQKYDILLHFSDDQLSSTVLMKTSDHRSSNEMKFIIKIFNAYTNNDYYRFFQLMRQADYMTSCVLSLYANKMRITGLKFITNACSSARQTTLYPAEAMIQCLGFDGMHDLKSFASSIGIEIHTKDEKEYLTLSKDLITTIRRSEAHLEPFKSSQLVESKMDGKSVGDLISDMIVSELPHFVSAISMSSSTTSQEQISGLENGPPTPVQPITEPKLIERQASPEFFRPIYSNSDEPLASVIATQNFDSTKPITIIEPAQPIFSKSIDSPKPDIPIQPEHFELAEHQESTEVDELIECLEPKNSKLTREEIADMMPAGRFKVVSLASKRPTLKLPENHEPQFASPKPKRFCISSETSRVIEKFDDRIQDEIKANKLLKELLNFVTH